MEELKGTAADQSEPRDKTYGRSDSASSKKSSGSGKIKVKVDVGAKKKFQSAVSPKISGESINSNTPILFGRSTENNVIVHEQEA